MDKNRATISDYIEKMAEISKSPQHEIIVECLEHYGLDGTRQLTLGQAAAFWEMVRLRNQEENTRKGMER